MKRIIVAAAFAAIGLAACGQATSSVTPYTHQTPPATPSSGATADDILCAQGLVAAMKDGVTYSVAHSANVTAQQQKDELTVGLDCAADTKRYGGNLDPAVWQLTAQAGYPRSHWDS